MKRWEMKFGGSQSFKTGISVYHIFHEASQFLPEIASNRLENFRIMMPDVGKRLGGSLSHITLHPTYGGSKNPRTNHYIDWFKWTSLKKTCFFRAFPMKYDEIWTCELTLQPIRWTKHQRPSTGSWPPSNRGWKTRNCGISCGGSQISQGESIQGEQAKLA